MLNKIHLDARWNVFDISVSYCEDKYPSSMRNKIALQVNTVAEHPQPYDLVYFGTIPIGAAYDEIIEHCRKAVDKMFEKTDQAVNPQVLMIEIGQLIIDVSAGKKIPV